MNFVGNQINRGGGSSRNSFLSGNNTANNNNIPGLNLQFRN